MKRLLIMAAIAGMAFLPSVAKAQERLGDGAMGALAGALVGGPIGLVAGGVVGYSAGPAIASSWGLKGQGIIAVPIIADIRRDNPALPLAPVPARGANAPENLSTVSKNPAGGA